MENNNLNEQIKENTAPATEASAKKSLPWWVFAAIGAGVVIIVAVILILTLGGCKAHVDADDDYKCDLCGKKFDDGDDTLPATSTDITFTVVDDNGNAMSGVSFDLSGTAGIYTITTNASGVAQQEIAFGKYNVSYDYTTLPSGFMPSLSMLSVSSDTTEVKIVVVDNNPNGTIARPFWISEDVTALSIAAGGEIYYAAHGSSIRTLVIKGEALELNYNGEVYTSTDGEIRIVLEGSIDEETRFSVRNVGSADIETNIEIIYPLGSRDNPIELTETHNSVHLQADQGIHYKWTATSNGVLVVSTDVEDSNIGISKVLQNDVSISASTAGSGYAYLVVSQGDLIAVSVSNDSKDSQDIAFDLAIYSGTDLDPVPVFKSYIDVSLLPGSSISFVATAGKELTIIDEDKITVTYGGTTENSADLGFIYIEFDADGIFTVTNTDTSVNGITMTFE